MRDLTLQQSADAPPAARRGFTLVELIVVLAIVALLFSLLMPALSSAALAGRMTKSQSNLRQMFIMAEAYSMRSDGRFPVGVRYERAGGEFFAWDWIQGPDGEVRPGPLWGQIDPGQVMQDPQCFSCESTFGADPFTGYNYNTTYIGGEATFPNTGWSTVRRGVPRSQWRRVETTAVFGLGGWKGGANKFMRAPMNTVENDLNAVYAGGQAFRYAGRTLVGYLDGHVAPVATPREGKLATDELLDDVMGYPDNGFLSDDDSAYDPR